MDYIRSITMIYRYFLKTRDFCTELHQKKHTSEFSSFMINFF
jgi:hypothetical protein